MIEITQAWKFGRLCEFFCFFFKTRDREDGDVAN